MTALVLTLLLGAHEELELQIARLTERIRSSPGEGRLYLQRAELHRLHRAAGPARADYEKARELDPGLPRVDLGQGRLELEEGRPAEALRHLDAYVARRPDDPAGRLERARAHAALAAWDRAKADYDAVLAVSPEAAPDVHLERIRALRSAGPRRREEAFRALDEALRRFGPLVALTAEAIDAELEAGRPDRALARIDAVLEVVGRKDRWLLRRGEILERMGRRDDARADWRTALREIEGLPAARRRSRETLDLEAALRARIGPDIPSAEDTR